MNTILEKIKNMSIEEQRSIPYEELKMIIKGLSKDEIIELSNIID